MTGLTDEQRREISERWEVAGKIIKKNGWIQGGYQDYFGFCMMGAFNKTIYMECNYYHACLMRHLAISEMASFIGVNHDCCPSVGSCMDEVSCSIVTWNDTPGRTKEEVLLYIEKFVDEYTPAKKE